MTEREQTHQDAFATRAVHSTQGFADETGAVMAPLYMTSTFAHGNPGGFDYTRSGNPNFTLLDRAMASAEDARFATCFASGVRDYGRGELAAAGRLHRLGRKRVRLYLPLIGAGLCEVWRRGRVCGSRGHRAVVGHYRAKARIGLAGKSHQSTAESDRCRRLVRTGTDRRRSGVGR